MVGKEYLLEWSNKGKQTRQATVQRGGRQNQIGRQTDRNRSQAKIRKLRSLELGNACERQI